MKKLPPERLKEIWEREEKATPGEWRAAPGKGSACVISPSCQIYSNVRSVELDLTVRRWQRDAEFIAHARQDIPALKEHIAALEAELEHLRGLMSFYQIETCELTFRPKKHITLEEWLTWFKESTDRARKESE